MIIEFSDISSEEWREYDFGNGIVVRIISPMQINVSASNGHRILDAEGLSHYIPSGWFHLRWQAKKGQPAFVK